ncbi:MAG: bifunctional oligoribonuclease/PAP phosphatase NrnA [Clostridia bacterium]|nr:bifunctional oligoribonuclease/PAP phosphatase NrnA [Clostridia bacterium]
MNLSAMQAVLAKIEEAQKIVIFRHKMPDGDAIGSTKGLREILRLSFPEKEIYLNNCDSSDYLEFLGDEDAPQPDEFYADALGIVIDTATAKRISNPRYALCREIVKIDHHIPIESYGATEWVEEERSSSCEMIVQFYDAFKDRLQMTKEAATYLYTGMVTDSGRFRYREVSGDTLRLAAILLDQGIDVDRIYAHLYMKDVSSMRLQAWALSHIKFTASGVAYLYITRDVQEKFGLTFESASAAVSYMDSIKDSLIWLAFIENSDGTIRVRLRSRFVTVSEIAECYGGGGHACAAGATVNNRREMNRLIADADRRLGEYKANNEGWL